MKLIINIDEEQYKDAINDTEWDTLSLGVYLKEQLKSGKTLQAELEEIKAEIQTKICQFYTGNNEIDMIKNSAFEDVIKILDNHIKELNNEIL